MSDVNKEIGLYPMSGDVVRFVSTAKLPIGGFETELHPIQDLHGQEYPYPAGGGKNLFNTTASTTTVAGVTWEVNEDGTVKASGTATGYSSFAIGSAYVNSALGNVTVSVEGISTTANVAINNINLLDVNGTVLTTIVSGSYVFTHQTIDLSDYPDAYRIAVNVKRGENGVVNALIKVQIEKGETSTSWTPYSNICPIYGVDSATIYVSPTPDIGDETVVHEIDFGETVYSGTLTINEDGSGQIVATTANRVFSVGGSWAKTNAGPYYIPMTGYLKADRITCWCSHYKAVANVNGVAGITEDMTCCFYGYEGTDRFYIRNDNIPTISEWRSWINDNPVQLVYELAEPITINLTVDQIETLIGFNYVWNNVGTTNITFQYYTGGEGMAITFLDCWTYPKAKLDEMFKAVDDRLDALEEPSTQASADSNAKTTTIEPKEIATEPVAEREGDE